MSRNYSASAQDAAHMINEIKDLTAEQAYDAFGVELKEDGSVFDPTYGMNFGSVGEWAHFTVEQDNVEYEEHFHG